MLPQFNLSGVLPPFDPGAGPAAPAGRSPYLVTAAELVAGFGTSAERRALLRSLFEYRASLRSIGLGGYQWIDGSFLEDVEMQRGRPPGDIDLVTFVTRPDGFHEQEHWHQFLEDQANTFWPEGAGLDCYLVDMSLKPEVIVSQAVYWFGLFSHQRETALWKGIVQINLTCDDEAAIGMLEETDSAH